MAHFSALQGILHEQAAQLTTTDENVVGPFDNRVEVRLFFDGPRYRQGGKDTYVGQRLQGGTQHDGEDEVASRGNPIAVESASPLGLPIAQDHRTVGGAPFCLLSGPVHSGGKLLEVQNAASYNLGVEALLQGFRYKVIR